MLFNQTFKSIRRVREIVRVLVKYGFEDVVANTVLINFVPQKQRLKWVREERPIFDFSRWERIRMVCEELGATFIKLAQVLSNRPDVLPEPLIVELEKLQNEVPPFEYEKVKAIIQSELGRPLEEIFEYFNEKPIGSASIGQVHRARLKNGHEVVVKVQRPEVARLIETDLNIIKVVVARGEKFFEKNGIINLMDVVEAFERSMQKELDYNNEARNIQMFRATFKKQKKFFAPAAYREYSSRRVLVLEYVKGCKITDVAQLRAWNLDPAKIAETGIDIYLTQIFEFGIFHADPHPGNVLVREDGVICLIDFGMVGKLSPKDKFAFAGIFVGMAQQNPKMTADSLRALAIDDNITDMRALEYELGELIEDFATLDVGESNMAEFSDRLQQVIYAHRIRLPGGVFIILRALAILEGIGKLIHPNFNTAAFIEPYGRKLLLDKYSPQNLGTEAFSLVSKLFNFLHVFPNEVRDILIRTRKGKLVIQVEHKGYEQALNRLDRTINRLILTLIIVALLISSSISLTILTGSNIQALITQSGIPYLSVIGFITAGALGLLLMYAVLRSRAPRN
ncbi:AarF/ABC1/UbiB kinase family protein [Sphingobacteriales bacterium UPWRP_1]|nr:ubiquinone biosynthesis protein [Sphingobacteriales bacterium TSM_CSM]PSJ75467.1 AarF/ABC1/UbiB kinase family protein [Sphingobacteriales bacterium UPWRP_1]